MKTKIKYLVITGALIFMSVLYTRQSVAQDNEYSYQIFYDQLSPYGQWVDYRDYGYVWMPDVDENFAPYSTNGRWIMTDYGMTWVSDYNWGWAPFHYGRWDYDNYYGWLWVPDNVWGPAWVTWRSASGYYGWAPMQPGVSINLSFVSSYSSNYNHWIFVRDYDIDRRDIHRYYINNNNHDMIIRNSRVINNTYVDNRHHSTYIAGPHRDEIRKTIGRNVRTASIHENNSPAQDYKNDKLSVYRPRIANNEDRKQNSHPVRVTNLKDAKQHSERNSNNLENQKRVKLNEDNKRELEQKRVQSNQNSRRQQQNIENQENINKSLDNRRKNLENKIQLDEKKRVQNQNLENQRNIKQAENNRRKQEIEKIQNDENKRRQQNIDNQNKIKQATDSRRNQDQKKVQSNENRRKQKQDLDNKKNNTKEDDNIRKQE